MTEESEKSKFGPKKILIIAIAVVGAFFLLLYISFIPAWLVSGSEGNNNYFIEISGLDSVKATGETVIMVPLPVYIDGEQVFSESLIKRVNDEPDVYRLNQDWNLSVENTPYGNMITLRTSEPELSDLNIRLAEFDRKHISRLLMPIINIPGDLTPEEFSKKESGIYQSCIYINGSFSPFDDPVEFHLRYTGGGDKEFMFVDPIWKSSISESVSFENIGYSNVSVNYLIADSWY